MITPGTAPEGAYIPGASFGPDNRGVNVNVAVDAAKAQMSAPYMASYGDIGQIFIDSLNGLLQAVVNGIVAGAQAVGMIVTGIIDTISGAIQWVTDGIASLFGVGAPPAMTVGSKLADAYDKQQELIGKVDELMEDNAGFINLCSSRDANVNWTANNWLVADFDTEVTEFKNAHCENIIIGHYEEPELIFNYYRETYPATGGGGAGGGIIFDAPGVWVLDGQVTFRDYQTSFRYFEVDLRIYEVGPYHPNGRTALNHYSSTRYATGAVTDYITSAPIHKPIIIPDDGKTYGAMLMVRNQTTKRWDLWGGARWSSLSAVRQSVDTTDYDARDLPTGSVAITE